MVEGITDEEINVWEDLIKQGKTIHYISKKYNRSWNTIVTAIRTKGKRSFNKIKDKDRENLKADFKDGKSIKYLTEKYKINVASVWRYVKKINENKRKVLLNAFNKRLNGLNDFDIGYFIGILEGEGCLSLRKEKSNRYRMGLSISNCSENMIKYISDKIPLHSNYTTRKTFRIYNRKSKNYSPSYEYKTNDKKVLKVLLSKIYPYAISKKKEIGIMLDFLSCTDNTTKDNLINKFIIIKHNKDKRNKIKLE